MSRMWGIGAYWVESRPKDRTQIFIQERCAEIGWTNNDAPALYEQFSRIEAGDIIYIKSKPPGNLLYIKAIGRVLDKPDGAKVKVEWRSNTTIKHDLSPIESHYNVYSLTLYEEMNATIRWEIKEKLRIAEDAMKSTEGK